MFIHAESVFNITLCMEKPSFHPNGYILEEPKKGLQAHDATISALLFYDQFVLDFKFSVNEKWYFTLPICVPGILPQPPNLEFTKPTKEL